ncbi:YciI family protein [uncultured Brevundimonas sp.]|uniref:YciI family protein n=1 Tax=uncultured Brevundimonas sp. TaxID=213418 RepID=UPI0030EC69B1
MSKFVFAYHGGPSSMTPEEGKAHMGKWMGWMESLGDAVVDRGLPVGKSKTVGPRGVTDDGGSNPLSGFTIVQADSIDAAVEMAKRSPHVEVGGTIEIAPALDMPM